MCGFGVTISYRPRTCKSYLDETLETPSDPYLQRILESVQRGAGGREVAVGGGNLRVLAEPALHLEVVRYPGDDVGAGGGERGELGPLLGLGGQAGGAEPEVGGPAVVGARLARLAAKEKGVECLAAFDFAVWRICEFGEVEQSGRKRCVDVVE